MTTINAHDYSVGEVLTAATMDGVTADLNTLLTQGIGEETAYLPAAALLSESGAEPGALEVLDFGTIVHYGIPFDKDTDEFIDFALEMPKRYDAGSIYLAAVWTTATGDGAAGDVVWQAEGNILNDGDALGTDPGSGGGNVTDAWESDGDRHRTSWFDVTPEGTATDDIVMVEIRFGRDADNGSDDLACDAYLLGISYRWTSDQETDD